MEEQKLIRRKKKALNGSNRRLLAEACSELAAFYYKSNKYEDALEEYRHEASIHKEMGSRLEWATSSRMIAEMYTLLAEFDQALKYEERHLSISRELGNQVEEQRALATLGRIYLLQAQSVTDDKLSKNSLNAAEKVFMKSLLLCESLKGRINTRELMDMRARLLLNIGVVQENLDIYEKSLGFIRKAETICVNQELHEVLFMCYKTEGLLYSNKMKDYPKALGCFNKALEIASRLEEKITTQCEILSLKADVLCKMADYHSAKQVLLKAYKLKSPDESEKENIEKNLKIVATICYTEELLITTNPTDHAAMKCLYEKLGDALCAVENFSDALKYYLKMLEEAQLCGDTGKKLIPIYVSLYQTYKDLGDYDKALEYYKKEYELIKDVPNEAYTTLANIAEALYCAKKCYTEVEEACFDARREAKKCCNTKYEIRILKHLLKYQNDYCEYAKMSDTKDWLKKLGYDDFDHLDSDEDECTPASDNIGDDICLDELTDAELSETNEELDVEKKREVRKSRGKGYVIKKNMKGETQLHVACISGKKLLVERLIARGHPVNVRDNAGWLPIHEAAIHGHLDIVEVLLKHGASINDRGGSNCDGITPLYDAASSGHLHVVSYLLDKGAIPSLKTDFGETPLQALQKWRNSVVLDKDEEKEYNDVCNKFCKYLERHTVDVNCVNSPQKEHGRVSASPLKKSKTPPSLSKNVFNEGLIRRRNVINESSDDESSDSRDTVEANDVKSKKYRKKDKGVREYREVISALRNRNVLDDSIDVEVKSNDKLSALLNANDVGDDWLDDDIKMNRNKRKYFDYAVENRPKKPLLESNKAKCIENIESDNSSDIESVKSCENVNPKPNIQEMLNRSESKDSRRNMNKRCKSQITLIKAGFRRHKSPESSESSNHNSDNDISIVKNSSANTSQTRLSLNKRVSNESNSSVKQFSPVKVMPPASVRVKIEDKTLLIPLRMETINHLTINWLVEEVKTRYYKVSGLRPSISLETSDGAILCEEDPLSLIIGSNELKANVDGMKPDPAEEHYLQCCYALNIPPDEDIQVSLARSYTTHRLTLGASTLSEVQIRPLFRALTHQSHITSLFLSDNRLGNTGLKLLIECLCTMRQLQCLDLTNNNITSEGIKILISMFEKTMRPICQSLEHLYLNSNPLGDEGFRGVLNLTCYVKLKTLQLCNCQISENAITESSKPAINFDALEILDLSYNAIKLKLACEIVTKMNPNNVLELELENIGVDGTVVGFLSTHLDSAKELKLRKLNLSKCQLVDSQFMRIFKTISRARNLQSIILKSNNLTFITLKKLMQRTPPIPAINLENCHNIFKYAQDSDFQIWLPAINFGRCVPDINVSPASTTDVERESFKLFSKCWLSCFKGRGVIEHCDGNVVKFTCK